MCRLGPSTIILPLQCNDLLMARFGRRLIPLNTPLLSMLYAPVENLDTRRALDCDLCASSKGPQMRVGDNVTGFTHEVYRIVVRCLLTEATTLHRQSSATLVIFPNTLLQTTSSCKSKSKPTTPGFSIVVHASRRLGFLSPQSCILDAV